MRKQIWTTDMDLIIIGKIVGFKVKGVLEQVQWE